MSKNSKTIQVNDLNEGSQIRAYILGIMQDLQTVRTSISNLQNNDVVLEMFQEKLSDANADLCALNNLMGEIIGYTIADDIWEKQVVNL